MSQEGNSSNNDELVASSQGVEGFQEETHSRLPVPEDNTALEPSEDKPGEVRSEEDQLPSHSAIGEIKEQKDTSETHEENKGIEAAPLIEEDVENKLYQSSSGPYSLVSLIDSIPTVNQELEGHEGAFATCIESWELNIYIGTSKGELLHFFQLDEQFGYMLISRQSMKNNMPVQKIVLLPELSRALVLCNSSVSCYMMPEMSPANIGKVKDVYDISLDVSAYKLDPKHSNRIVPSSEKTKSITAVFFTSRSLRFVMITEETMKLIRDMNYPNLKTGIRSSTVAVVGTSSSYDLLDLEKGKKNALFPISSDSPNASKLAPHVVPITSDEFLLTCGTNPGEPALGMVINKSGDISRGTIPWMTYPSNAISDYPHIITSFGEEIQIHSLQDQNLVQTIKFHKSVKISTVSHIFNRKFEDIVDIVRLLPISADLNAESVVDRIKEEKAKAVELANVSSSSLVFSPDEGVKLLVPTPLLKRILELAKGSHLESIYDDIEDEIASIDKSTSYGELQKDFSMITSFLTLLQHSQFDRAFDYFIDNKLNPQIAIFLCCEDTRFLYDEFWIYNGLAEKLKQLRTWSQNVLHSEDTTNDDLMVLRFAMDEFYRLLIKNFVNREMDSGTQPQIMKSAQVIYFFSESSARQFKKLEEVETFIKSLKLENAYAEIIEELKLREMYVLMAAIDKSTGKHLDVINTVISLQKGEISDSMFKQIFTVDEDVYSFLVKYIIENIHDEDLIWKYGQWLLKQSPKFGVELFSSADLKASISELKVLKMLRDNNLQTLIVKYLEILVLDKNEIQFIGDLIYEVTKNFVDYLKEHQDTVDKLSSMIETYKKMDTPKLSFARYLGIEFKIFDDKLFCELHNHLFNFLLISSKDTTTITQTSNINIIGYCRQQLGPFAGQLRYMMSLIEFQLDEFSGCIDQLCSLTDFRTAEYIATRLSFPYNLSNYSDKIDKFIDLHRSRVNSRLQSLEDLQDEDATLVGKSIATASEGTESLTEELLLQIFEIYLQLDNYQLIESFLNNHHLFDLSQQDADSGMDKLLERFELVLTKLPPSFPTALINDFLTSTVIQLREAEQNKAQVKNLDKAINRRLKQTLRDLQQNKELGDL